MVHRALVVATAAGLGAQATGATLRVADVCAALEAAGHEPTVIAHSELARQRSAWCVGVAVSYACAPALRTLQRITRRTWLDAIDSWLQVDLSGLRAGRPSYAARAVRDAARLVSAPRCNLVTYISRADLMADRRTVNGDRRLVLPGRVEVVTPRRDLPPRLVLTGDWDYPPNADGLRWFTQRVLPLLRRHVDVYGRGKVPVHPLLKVHGHTADVSELYGALDVHLAPVLYGGGVKRKVLQPLLAGLPVVATLHAARGLRPHPLLVGCHTPLAFASEAARLAAAQPVASSTGVHPDADDTATVVRWLSSCDSAVEHYPTTPRRSDV